MLRPCPARLNYRKQSPKSTSDHGALVYWSFNSFSLLIADLTVTAEVVLQEKKKTQLLAATNRRFSLCLKRAHEVKKHKAWIFKKFHLSCFVID